MSTLLVSSYLGLVPTLSIMLVSFMMVTDRLSLMMYSALGSVTNIYTLTGTMYLRSLISTSALSGLQWVPVVVDFSIIRSRNFFPIYATETLIYATCVVDYFRVAFVVRGSGTLWTLYHESLDSIGMGGMRGGITTLVALPENTYKLCSHYICCRRLKISYASPTSELYLRLDTLTWYDLKFSLSSALLLLLPPFLLRCWLVEVTNTYLPVIIHL